MKKFLAILSCLIAGASGGFIEGLEDMPLAPNWSQVKEEIISFGNQETNFVQLNLESSNESFDTLIDFYKTTLPQLGWKFEGLEDGSYEFIREKEILIFENINKNARITHKMSN
ncbi:MAG: hypothetical protein R3Y43_05605 [Alphaproteobacteria bacterium]